MEELHKASAEAGITLPSGAGTKSDQVAAKLLEKGGMPMLEKYAKLHFANTEKALKLLKNKRCSKACICDNKPPNENMRSYFCLAGLNTENKWSMLVSNLQQSAADNCLLLIPLNHYHYSYNPSRLK